MYIALLLLTIEEERGKGREKHKKEKQGGKEEHEQKGIGRMEVGAFHILSPTHNNALHCPSWGEPEWVSH